ncbi:response regulator transcription factor [Taklimakanibacter deserti]|uniref:response regulator transcription factor n=1 Tax=Taklimakanibacter deserti TaxID=2267839 RepID=UPI000E64CB81
MRKHYKILVVEDEPAIRLALADHLDKEGFEVLEADSGERAIELIKKSNVDLIVTDIQMPGWHDGIGLALWVRENHPHIKLIIVSGATDESSSLLPLGAEGTIYTKPYSVEEIGLRAEALLHETRHKPVNSR